VRWMLSRGIIFMHVPLESVRSQQGRAIQKAMGASKGFPDYIIITKAPLRPEARGIFIEMKRRRGGRASAEQGHWISMLLDNGWQGAACNGARDAVEFLKGLGF